MLQKVNPARAPAHTNAKPHGYRRPERHRHPQQNCNEYRNLDAIANRSSRMGRGVENIVAGEQPKLR